MAKDFFVSWNSQSQCAELPVIGAENDEFILQDGRRLYDFISTSFQASFGHSQQLIRSAIHNQLDQMPVASPKATFDLKRRVSSRLLDYLGLAEGKLFYTVSGAEAVENALKIARQMTGRRIVLCRQRSYHGATLGAMSVSGDWRSNCHLTFAEGTRRIPEPDEDPHADGVDQVLRAAGADNVAAIIVETISGTNGVHIPDQTWWDGIERICREHGVLLIVDEVLCGFGRTGRNFAFQHYQIEPDMVCMSKAISGGYVPFGAVWATGKIANYYDENVLACGLTGYAHPLGLAALEGVLQLTAQPEFRSNQSELETIFRGRLESLGDDPAVRDVRIKGMLAAIELHGDVCPTWDFFSQHGLYLFCKPNMIVLAPPLISRPGRLNAALDTLSRQLTDAVFPSIRKT